MDRATGADARDHLRGTLGEDPFGLVADMEEAGEEKARAAGVAYRLEQERKHVLARVQNRIANAYADRSMSEAKLERLARADEEYRKHLEGTAAAIEAREAATSRYYAIKARLEWLRAAVAHWNASLRDTP